MQRRRILHVEWQGHEVPDQVQLHLQHDDLRQHVVVRVELTNIVLHDALLAAVLDDPDLHS